MAMGLIGRPSMKPGQDFLSGQLFLGPTVYQQMPTHTR